MSEESIIGDCGTLTIGSKAVTWFTLLQVSRSTNSKEKGWKSKTHWSTKGLDRLTKNGEAADFLATWTRNSLHSNALPKPREYAFQFEDRLMALKEGKRGRDEAPEDESENLINWGLAQWLHNKGKPFKPSSYEVPLASEKQGQLKVDMMVFHEFGRIEIIELKRSGEDDPDPPLMALTEAICYAIQTTRCWANLSKDAGKHLGAKSFGKLTEIHLILAAPDYWINCNPGRGETRRITSDQVTKLHAVVAAVGAELSGVKLSLSLADIGKDGLGLKKASIDESPEPPAWSILSLHKKAHSPS